MKEFKIGQRVRILEADDQFGFLVGRCGTITSRLRREEDNMVQDVDVDGVPPLDGDPWCGSPEFMEPIDEDDVGDWRVIEHVTGWSPTKEKVS